MNRRGFFKALAAAAVGAAATHVLDPEKLLWVPGQKTHFIAPAMGWMSPSGPVMYGFDHGAGDALGIAVTSARDGQILQVLNLGPGEMSFSHEDLALDRLAQDERFKHIIDDAVKQLAADIDANLFRVVFDEGKAVPPTISWKQVASVFSPKHIGRMSSL